MKFLAIIGYALRVTISQKIMIVLLTVLTIIIGLFIFTIHIDAVGGYIKSISIYGSKPMTSEELPMIMPTLGEIYITFIFLAMVVLCIITTAHIIPESLSNGTIDLFLSKPLSRASIVLGMFVGVILAVALVQLYFIVSFWFVLNIKTGSWNWMFPLTFVPLILSFISIFSLMVFVGIISKSTGVVIAIALGHVLLLSNLLSTRGGSFGLLSGNIFFRGSKEVLYYLLPQYSDLYTFAKHLLLGQQFQVTVLFYPILPCTVFIILSMYIFQRMDF